MARKWYPVVDIFTCIECGTCSANCPHAVYDAAKHPAAVVINPDGCVDHCHKCGNNCPVGAITYVGDDTGWIPPALRTEQNVNNGPQNSCCCCGK